MALELVGSEEVVDTSGATLASAPEVILSAQYVVGDEAFDSTCVIGAMVKLAEEEVDKHQLTEVISGKPELLIVKTTLVFRVSDKNIGADAEAGFHYVKVQTTTADIIFEEPDS